MRSSLRFRYNPVFLPEYFSTVTISIPISFVMLATGWGGQGRLRWQNTNVPIALTAYCGIAAFLILLTLFYRRKYRRMLFRVDDSGDVTLVGKGHEFRLRNLDRVEEEVGQFFGRKARTVRLEDAQGWPMEVCEAIVNYEGFKRILSELSNQDIEQQTISEADQRDYEKTAYAWRERHQMFPAPRAVSEVVARLGWRCVCLLPVGVFDVLINIAIILSLDALDQMRYAVWSAPLSLMTSGLVARFVYYYMFTSTAMNKPIGT